MFKEYHHKTKLSYEESIESVKASLMEHKFGTLCTIGLSDKFKDQNLEYEGRLTILEVCNPKEANKIITINPKALYILPCKIIVQEFEGTTTIKMITPTSMFAIFDNPELTEIAQNIENIIVEAIEKI